RSPGPLRGIAVRGSELPAGVIQRRGEDVVSGLRLVGGGRVVPPRRRRIREEADRRLPRRPAADVLPRQLTELVVEQATDQAVLEGQIRSATGRGRRTRTVLPRLDRPKDDR